MHQLTIKIRNNHDHSSTLWTQTHTTNRTFPQTPHLHAGHVHDAPPHAGPFPHVAAQHVGDDNLGEVDIGDALKTGIVDVLGKPGVATSRHEYLRRDRTRRCCRRRRRSLQLVEVGEVGEEWGSELGPLGVPLEGVVAASYGEELVPVLLAGEVT